MNRHRSIAKPLLIVIACGMLCRLADCILPAHAQPPLPPGPPLILTNIVKVRSTALLTPRAATASANPGITITTNVVAHHWLVLVWTPGVTNMDNVETVIQHCVYVDGATGLILGHSPAFTDFWAGQTNRLLIDGTNRAEFYRGSTRFVGYIN
jgi:hypothetical protein